MPASMVVRTGVNEAPNEDVNADALGMDRSTHRALSLRASYKLRSRCVNIPPAPLAMS
jgi:hypothetical protein